MDFGYPSAYCFVARRGPGALRSAHPPLPGPSMTQTHVSLDFSGSDIASQRARAVACLIATARRLIPEPTHATPEQLRATASALEALGLQRELFPLEHFPVSEANPAQVYR